MEHIDRRPVRLQHLVDTVDRHVHAGTKPAGVGKNHSHLHGFYGETPRCRIVNDAPVEGFPSPRFPVCSAGRFSGAIRLATIRPFAGIRYANRPDIDFSSVIAPPYDVLDETGKA